MNIMVKWICNSRIGSGLEKSCQVNILFNGMRGRVKAPLPIRPAKFC